MGSELSDKTHVLVTRLGDFWVKLERGNAIMGIKQNDPQATIEMDGSFIAANNIDGLLTAVQYNELQIKRRGGWQCKYGYWHEKFNQCAHHMLGAQRK
jgi:hypothetical protein